MEGQERVIEVGPVLGGAAAEAGAGSQNDGGQAPDDTNEDNDNGEQDGAEDQGTNENDEGGEGQEAGEGEDEGAGAEGDGKPAKEPAKAAPAAAPAAAPPAEPVAHELDWVKTNKVAERALEAIKAGKLTEFLQRAATDYTKMTPEEVIRLDVERKNPGRSPLAIEALYKKQIAEFDLGTFDDENGTAGKELREAHAEQVREALMAEQQEYIANTPVIDPEVTRRQQEQETAMAERRQYLTTHPDLVAFERDRRIKVGEGQEAFNFEADPTLNAETILSPDHFFSQFWSKDPKSGKEVFDMPRFLRVQAYAKNPTAFENGLANHYRGLGTKDEFNERHNAGDGPKRGSAPGASKKGYVVERGK